MWHSYSFRIPASSQKVLSAALAVSLPHIPLSRNESPFWNSSRDFCLIFIKEKRRVPDFLVYLIGNRIETPEGVFYELEYGGEGNIYKNEDAFLNRPDEVCYVPEYAAEDREDWRVSESSDGCFTHNSLLALCKGNEEVCQDLFYSLEWTYPTTLLEEWDSNGYFDEIEGWYDSND